jgi:G3E family GTPase
MSQYHVLRAVEQIAFADRILLNKTDLVAQAELENIKQRIKVSKQARNYTVVTYLYNITLIILF